MIQKIYLYVLFLFFCFSISAYSCDLCGCYIPQSAIVKGLQIGIAEQYSSLSDLSLDGNVISNEENQYLHSSYTQLLASYQFNETTSIQLNVPLIYRSYQRAEHENLERGTESGLGDMILLGSYVPFQRSNPQSHFRWQLMAGLKFPTGNSDPIAEELLEDHERNQEDELELPGGHEEHLSGVHGHDIALGSGSWDGLIGTSLYGRSNRWFYSASVQYAIRSTGDFEYRYANDLLWYGGAGYGAIAHEDFSLGLQALFTGEHKGEDQLNGVEADDTAITALYLGPHALIGIKQVALAEVGIGFPMYVDNSGLQTVPKYRFRLAFSWRFQ